MKSRENKEKSQDTRNFDYSILWCQIRTTLTEAALPQLPRAVIELPSVATPVAPTQIPARSPPTKKAKTSEPGESSRAARDSQSQPPPTRRPILTSSPIEGNSDCRARAFHDEAYFDHYVLRQLPELGDSYRLLERVPYYQEVSLPPFYYHLLLEHWGQCSAWLGGELRKEVLLLMLSYFGNLVAFCLILKFLSFYSTLHGY
ncbi:hypothetical protein AAG906_021134 [Vitis piasezkii]